MSEEELDAVISRLAECDNRDVCEMWDRFCLMKTEGDAPFDVSPLAFLQSLHRNGVLDVRGVDRMWQILWNRPQRWYNVTLEVT